MGWEGQRLAGKVLTRSWDLGSKTFGVSLPLHSEPWNLRWELLELLVQGLFVHRDSYLFLVSAVFACMGKTENSKSKSNTRSKGGHLTTQECPAVVCYGGSFSFVSMNNTSACSCNKSWKVCVLFVFGDYSLWFDFSPNFKINGMRKILWISFSVRLVSQDFLIFILYIDRKYFFILLDFCNFCMPNCSFTSLIFSF